MEKKLSIRFAAFASMTIAWETGGDKSGGYTRDPKDRGGETKWGISKRAHPDLNIKALTYNDAIRIYYTEYWTDCYSDINSPVIAFKLFDMGVLAGTKTAVRLLQKSINSIGYHIRVDGNCGPITLAAINAANESRLYNTYIDNLTKYFKRIIWIRPSNRKFLIGWLRRVNYHWQA